MFLFSTETKRVPMRRQPQVQCIHVSDDNMKSTNDITPDLKPFGSTIRHRPCILRDGTVCDPDGTCSGYDHEDATG